MVQSAYDRFNERRRVLMQADLPHRLFAPLQATRMLYSFLELDADYANGVDVSHWQGEIDWPKLATKAEFAFIKATDSTFTDSYFARNAVKAETAGMPRSFFHFLRSSPSGVEQAKYLIATAKNKAGGLGELPVMVDTEVALSLAVVKGFIYTIYGQTGYYPLMYGSKRTWEELVSGTQADKAFAAVCPLFVASWYTLVPVLPYTWKDWVVHQYTNKGNGADYGVSSKSIDLDRARRSWLNQYIHPIPPPTPDPEDDMALLDKIKVVKDAYPEASIVINVNLTEGTVEPPSPPQPPAPKPADVKTVKVAAGEKANGFWQVDKNGAMKPMLGIKYNAAGNPEKQWVPPATLEVHTPDADVDGTTKFYEVYGFTFSGNPFGNNKCYVKLGDVEF